jgi:hypothetical protein
LYQFMVLRDSLAPVGISPSGKASPKSTLLTYKDNLVRYTVPADQNVKLELWDTRGKLVAALDGGYKSAGIHQMSLPNNTLGSGTYILKLSLGAKRADELKIRWIGP